jgi:hypothetical protein
MRSAAAVAAVAIAGALAWVVWGLTSTGPRLAGTNSTLLGSYVGTVPRGDRLCQAGEAIPAAAADLEVFTGVFGRPGPPLELRVSGRIAGRLPAGYADGWTRIPLDAAFRDRPEALENREICLVNRGRTDIAFAGLRGSPETAARIDGRPAEGRMSLRWTAADRGTWWSQAATIAQRMTFGKADFGRWVPLVTLLLVWVGAFGLILRSSR